MTDEHKPKTKKARLKPCLNRPRVNLTLTKETERRINVLLDKYEANQGVRPSISLLCSLAIASLYDEALGGHFRPRPRRGV